MLVEEYILGNTRIRIYDAYVGKTEEDIKAILKRIEDLGYRIFRDKE